MKQILLSFVGAMFTCTAFAQSCVNVKQAGANYANKTVTFVLTWSGCNGTNHLNTVWCFIDWRTADAAGNKGNWTHATISGTPAVTGASLGTVQTDGFWVTGNSSATVTVKLGNVPDMFDWCAFASDCKSTGQAVSVAGCTNTSICLGETGFSSTQTWVVGAQTWSAPVTATYCNKTTYSSPATTPYGTDCRTNPGYDGHLFSWCMVARYAAQLCPSPWRAPAYNDFCTLDKTLNNRSNCNARDDAAARNRYLSTSWGAQANGIVSAANVLSYRNNVIAYQSISTNSTTYCYVFYISDIGIHMHFTHDRFWGRSLRCVK